MKTLKFKIEEIKPETWIAVLKMIDEVYGNSKDFEAKEADYKARHKIDKERIKKQLSSEYEMKLEILKQQLSETKSACESTIKTMSDLSKTQYDSMSSSYQKRITELEETNAQNISKRLNELRDLHEKTISELNERRNKLCIEFSDAELKYKEQIRSLNVEKDNLIKTLEEKLNDQETKYTEKIKNLETGLKAADIHNKMEIEDLIRNISKDKELTLGKIETAHKEQIENLKLQHAKQLEDLKQSNELANNFIINANNLKLQHINEEKERLLKERKEIFDAITENMKGVNKFFGGKSKEKGIIGEDMVKNVLSEMFRGAEFSIISMGNDPNRCDFVMTIDTITYKFEIKNKGIITTTDVTKFKNDISAAATHDCYVFLSLGAAKLNIDGKTNFHYEIIGHTLIIYLAYESLVSFEATMANIHILNKKIKPTAAKIDTQFGDLVKLHYQTLVDTVKMLNSVIAESNEIRTKLNNSLASYRNLRDIFNNQIAIFEKDLSYSPFIVVKQSSTLQAQAAQPSISEEKVESKTETKPETKTGYNDKPMTFKEKITIKDIVNLNRTGIDPEIVVFFYECFKERNLETQKLTDKERTLLPQIEKYYNFLLTKILSPQTKQEITEHVKKNKLPKSYILRKNIFPSLLKINEINGLNTIAGLFKKNFTADFIEIIKSSCF